MRPSNRTKILQGAVAVVEREGISALTFDAVAAEAEMTRGGIMYHFRSRAELVEAIHAHMAQEWVTDQEKVLRDVAGGHPEEATQDDAAIAYLRGSSAAVTRAELQLQLEASTNPDAAEHWREASARILPDPPADAEDEEAITRLLAVLVADGLWIHEAVSFRTLDPAVRKAIIERVEKLVRDGD